MRLEGKRAVITGAATGIGRATAVSFAKEGTAVVIGDINDEGGHETVKEITATGGAARFVHTDVTSADAMDALMAEADNDGRGIDIIFNNAGAQRSGPVTEFAEAEWDLLMAVNPRACFLGAKYGIPHLRRRGRGSIINMASLAAIKGGPGMTAYSASKGAIVAFTKALAAETAPESIRVNCICPGWIDTPFNRPAWEFMGGRGNLEEFVKANVPMGRQGLPEEIAPLVLYLASDESSYMTGQALIVDGGIS